MKEIAGYLIDRTTGAGISGKAVSFKNLAGVAFASQASPYIGLDAVTDGDGRFRGRFEFSPGPVNVEVTVSGTEKKARKWDEQAQLRYAWSSDIRNLARAIRDGVIDGFLDEMAVSIPSGHTIRIAKGAAVFNGNVFSIENGNYDIAGTDNTNPALNPRLDLITLRQYNEDAPGQDAGRQEVVVTLGTSQNVAPVTPTGATFKDYPLAVVSTAYNAATKTVSSDLRTFTGNTVGQPELYAVAPVLGTVGLAATYGNDHAVITFTGLDPLSTYDGEMHMEGMAYFEDVREAENQVCLAKVDKPELVGGAINDRYVARHFFQETDVSGRDYSSYHRMTLSHPISGVTGVSTYTIPIKLRKMNSLAVQGNIWVSSIHAYAVLRKRR